jgi:hypothetical protein
MKRFPVWRRWVRLPDRLAVALLALAALLTHALWPRVAWAGCGVTDFSACADDAQYTIWYGVASFLWAIDAMLLQLAYCFGSGWSRPPLPARMACWSRWSAR